MNMPKITISYAVALILLGIIGYFATGMVSITALIPLFFGLPVMALGMMAANPARRKHFMHVAAALGLLGIVGSIKGLGGLFTIMGGGEVARPGATISKSIMAILSLIFVLLCVKSFIDARKKRSQ